MVLNTVMHRKRFPLQTIKTHLIGLTTFFHGIITSSGDSARLVSRNLIFSLP